MSKVQPEQAQDTLTQSEEAQEDLTQENQSQDTASGAPQVKRPWYQPFLALKPLLELDLRALALFRVLFGLLCVGKSV